MNFVGHVDQPSHFPAMNGQYTTTYKLSAPNEYIIKDIKMNTTFIKIIPDKNYMSTIIPILTSKTFLVIFLYEPLLHL